MSNGIINPNGSLSSWRPRSNRDMTPREPDYIKDRESFKRRIAEKNLKNTYRKLILKNKLRHGDRELKTLGLIVTFGPFKGRRLCETNLFFTELFIKHSGYRFKLKAVQKVQKRIKHYRLDQKLKDKYI